MLLEAIRLRNVRRFGSEGIAIEGIRPGLNVLSRPNEFGKSTILDALRAALFWKATSKAEPVQSLVPFPAGGDPEIEIDFAVGNERLRLRKCFALGRKGSATELLSLPGERLLLREAEAEARIAEIVGADKPMAGPTGLLWLSQGEALKPRVDGLQTQTMATLLTDEMTDVAGGEEARRLGSRIREELAKLETPRSGKPAGELKEAIEAVAAAQQAFDDLEQRVRRGRERRDELLSIRAEEIRLTDPDERERHRAELAEAEQAARDAAVLKTELGHTRESLDVETERLEQAVKRLADFDQASKSLKNIKEHLGMAGERQARLIEGRGMAEAERAAARRARDDAERRVASLRRTLTALGEQERRAARRAERDRIAGQLSEAEKVERALRGAEARAKGPNVDRAALINAEKAVLEAETRLAAEAPEIEVEAGADVTVDGVAIAPGARARVTGEGLVEAPGLRLRVRGPGAARHADHVAEARRALDRLLGETGATSVAEALASADGRELAAAEAAMHRRELARLAPDGVARLRQVLADLPDDTDGSPDPLPDRAALEEDLAEAERASAAAQGAERAALERLEAFSEEATRLEIALRTGEAERARLEALLGPEENRAALRADLERETGARRERVEGLKANLVRLGDRLRASDELAARLKRLRGLETQHQERLQNLRIRQAELRAALREHYAEGAEEQRDAAGEALQAAKAHRDRLETRRRALGLLRRVLEEEQGKRREKIVGPVMAELGPMVTHVFGDGRVHFDSEWNPSALERGEGPDDIAALSEGTREQVRLLARLAFARLLAKEGAGVPLILDDAIVYADDARAGRLFDLLHRVAEDTQVIVLTCRDRLFDDLGGHRLEPRPFPAS